MWAKNFSGNKYFESSIVTNYSMVKLKEINTLVLGVHRQSGPDRLSPAHPGDNEGKLRSGDVGLRDHESSLPGQQGHPSQTGNCHPILFLLNSDCLS